MIFISSWPFILTPRSASILGCFVLSRLILKVPTFQPPLASISTHLEKAHNISFLGVVTIASTKEQCSFAVGLRLENNLLTAKLELQVKTLRSKLNNLLLICTTLIPT